MKIEFRAKPYTHASLPEVRQTWSTGKAWAEREQGARGGGAATRTDRWG
jgi:hypothetical protein